MYTRDKKLLLHTTSPRSWASVEPSAHLLPENAFFMVAIHPLMIAQIVLHLQLLNILPDDVIHICYNTHVVGIIVYFRVWLQLRLCSDVILFYCVSLTLFDCIVQYCFQVSLVVFDYVLKYVYLCPTVLCVSICVWGCPIVSNSAWLCSNVLECAQMCLNVLNCTGLCSIVLDCARLSLTFDCV